MLVPQEGRYEALDLADLPPIKAGSKTTGYSSMMFDPVFGPVGKSPLEKETVLGFEVRCSVPTVQSLHNQSLCNRCVATCL